MAGHSKSRRKVSETFLAFAQELSSLDASDVNPHGSAAKAKAANGEESATEESHVNIAAAMELFGPGANLAQSSLSGKLWKTGALQAVLCDWAVLKSDTRDYGVAFAAALLEVERLQAEASQMTSLCQRAEQLQQMLDNEAQAQASLRAENARIASENNELTNILYKALEASGDVERDAFVDRLIVENEMLWKVAQLQQTVSSRPALAVPHQALPALRAQRPSRSSRAHSSSSSTPPGSNSSWLSPDRRPGACPVASLSGAVSSRSGPVVVGPLDSDGDVHDSQLSLFGRVDELEGLVGASNSKERSASRDAPRSSPTMQDERRGERIAADDESPSDIKVQVGDYPDPL
mmetsp:Transcript_43241/g.101712  ORF Transcript_43241/g.101712 Transcript_43241/m.101712 type:complete len:349 (-) Transcript_43241:50-1096(-)